MEKVRKSSADVQLHAAHNAKYTSLHFRSRKTQQDMLESLGSVINAVEKALESSDAAICGAVLSPLRSMHSDWQARLPDDTLLGRANAYS